MASAWDTAQASLAPRLLKTVAGRALRRRSGLQTRERSLKPNPKPKLSLDTTMISLDKRALTYASICFDWFLEV